MSSGEDKYWYNTNTGQVEKGFLSPAPERVGPFDTEEEASHALERLAERSRAWAVEDDLEDNWGSAPTSGDTAR